MTPQELENAVWENISTEYLSHGEFTTGGEARFAILVFWTHSFICSKIRGRARFFASVFADINHEAPSAALGTPSTSSAPASLQGSSVVMLLVPPAKNYFAAQQAQRPGILTRPDRALVPQLEVEVAAWRSLLSLIAWG
jgi:hypothetical protein